MVSPTPMTMLLVDDDEVLRTRLARAFERRGIRVLQATAYEEAVAQLAAGSPSMAVLDLKMPGQSGLELLKTLKQRSPGIQAIVLTGYGSIANAVEALRLGAIGYVTKPADADQVLDAFQKGTAAADEADIAYKPLSLAAAEWNHIQNVLSDCNGNISQAAKLLDIPRRTLQRKLRKLAP